MFFVLSDMSNISWTCATVVWSYKFYKFYKSLNNLRTIYSYTNRPYPSTCFSSTRSTFIYVVVFVVQSIQIFLPEVALDLFAIAVDVMTLSVCTIGLLYRTLRLVGWTNGTICARASEAVSGSLLQFFIHVVPHTRFIVHTDRLKGIKH